MEKNNTKTEVIETANSKLTKHETDYINDSSSSLTNKNKFIEFSYNKTNRLYDSNTKNSGMKNTLEFNSSDNYEKKNEMKFQTEWNKYKEKRKSFNNKSRISDPNYMYKTKFIDQSSMHHLYSENISITKEYSLKVEIDQLQEKLKDTEERLQSLKIQYDSLSQLHRDLRENRSQIQVESEHLKLEVQNLTECANILRSELKGARNDRNEILEIQNSLLAEFDKCKNSKKKLTEQNDKDLKIIQDLQRQCKEMEEILMRKHPDSIAAFIVASKNSTQSNEYSSIGRHLLEQRIAQLEADAKKQDFKAQQILANVQAKFNSVQDKYETHIADLETQVLSLQEINTKLNKKIEFQIATLNNFSKSNDGFKSSCTQTDEIPEIEGKIVTISTQTDLKIPAKSIGNIGSSTGAAKKTIQSKIPSSYFDTQISVAYHSSNKEDAHLLATIRGMRVDLAIKEKAMQRLSKELDECKKTIKKLQKEKEATKPEKFSTLKTSKDLNQNSRQQNISESQILKEALNKIRLLELDYKALHDKRLQDLKTLQAVHDRELTACHDSVQILQQRLAERDETFANQKRRKIPIDYYALKAKV